MMKPSVPIWPVTYAAAAATCTYLKLCGNAAVDVPAADLVGALHLNITKGELL
jgi:hypothetical protein